MREIKFRAWDKKVKRMRGPITLEWLWDDSESESMIKSEDLVFQLFTGVKDVHGTEIYEGDILSDGKKIMFVHWADVEASWWCKFTDNYDYKSLGILLSFGEPVPKIIGNIYENPGLLITNGRQTFPAQNVIDGGIAIDEWSTDELGQKEAADITIPPPTSPNGRITEEHLDKCVMCGNPATHIQEHFGEPLCDNPTCEREALEADTYMLDRKHN